VGYLGARMRELDPDSDRRARLFVHLGELDDDAPMTRERFALGQLRLAERSVERARVSDGDDVLEVGCGFGGNLAVLLSRARPGQVVGLDQSREALSVAERALGERVRLVQGDACALPFDEGSFDVVLAIECAFHFASRERFAQEARRVLRPGGRLVLTDLVGRGGGSDPQGLLSLLSLDLAPLPDPRGPEGGWGALGERVGLAPRSVEDLGAAARSSLAYILAGKPADPRAYGPSDDRGVAALARALDLGLVGLERWVLERPEEPPR